MKLKFIIPVLLFISLSVMSQEAEKKDKIKSLKVAFLTTELNLSSDEAAKFWPVYNAFDEKQHHIRRSKIHSVMKKLEKTDLNKISEKEATVYLNQLESSEEELLHMRKKLFGDLKPIIGSVKMLRLKKAEQDFNRKLLSKYKGKNKK